MHQGQIYKLHKKEKQSLKKSTGSWIKSLDNDY